MEQIKVEDFRRQAIDALAAIAPREYLEKEPVSRLINGIRANGLDLPEPTTKTCHGCGKTKALADYPDIDSRECFRCGLGDTPARQAWQSRVYMRDLMRTRRTGTAG